jgi:hypothetical protein
VIDGVGDLALEGPDRLALRLSFFDLALVGARRPSSSFWRIWQMAAMCIAWFNCRSPRCEARWTTRPPEENSTGAVPLYAAYESRLVKLRTSPVNPMTERR